MFVVVVLVVYALSVFGDEKDLAKPNDEDTEETEVTEKYTPKLKEVEQPSVEEMGENDQEEIVVEGGSESDSFSSTDASLEENKDASNTYEDFDNANFDEKD